MNIVVITGMSGAGKASTIRVLEDLGFSVVDNIAPALFDSVAAHSAQSGTRHLALVCDSRVGDEYGGLLDSLGALRKAHEHVVLLFLDASDAALVQRFKESRRPHPVPTPSGGILPSIALERGLLARTRESADKVIDTSALTVPELRAQLETSFAGLDGPRRIAITITSFGFKHGLPLDADLVFDVRFLRNPYWVGALRPLDGTSPDVRDYVLSDPDAEPLLDRIYDLIAFSLPRYRQEGKAYLTIAIGCTGGRHRSVTVAETLRDRLQGKGEDYRVFVQHRDVAIESPQEPVQ